MKIMGHGMNNNLIVRDLNHQENKNKIKNIKIKKKLKLIDNFIKIYIIIFIIIKLTKFFKIIFLFN